MVDLMIYESGNGGELSLKNGNLEITNAVFNQIYIAHFGGNIEAVTGGVGQSSDVNLDWWGNSLLNTQHQMNSYLERALNENPLTSAGRVAIERAAKADVEFLNIAEIHTTASIIGTDKVKISHKVNQTTINFIWDSTKNEIIKEITI